MTVWKKGRAFLFAEEGAVATEYGMLMALIVAVVLLGVRLLGVAVAGLWAGIMDKWP